jgi:hypothetical protein
LLSAVVVLLSALVVAGCATSSRTGAGRPGEPAAPTSAPTAPAARTVVRTFVAFAGAGRLPVPVAEHHRGHCWAGSIAAPGPHAYRCFAGNTILDPCFAAATPVRPRTVACLADPWSAATVLRLTKRLPALSPSQAPARPWALVLTGGARCVAATGTVPEVGGVNLPYGCDDKSAAALLDRAGGQQQAYTAALTANAVRQVGVRVLWRA